MQTCYEKPLYQQRLRGMALETSCLTTFHPACPGVGTSATGHARLSEAPGDLRHFRVEVCDLMPWSDMKESKTWQPCHHAVPIPKLSSAISLSELWLMDMLAPLPTPCPTQLIPLHCAVHACPAANCSQSLFMN